MSLDVEHRKIMNVFDCICIVETEYFYELKDCMFCIFNSYLSYIEKKFQQFRGLELRYRFICWFLFVHSQSSLSDSGVW